jgi:hypothetical protein
VRVILFPQSGTRQAVRQVFEFRYLPVLQLKQFLAVIEQVAHVASHVLHIRLSDRSGYSLLLMQEAAQALVPLFPTVGSGQSVTQFDPDKNLGELHDKHELSQFNFTHVLESIPHGLSSYCSAHEEQLSNFIEQSLQGVEQAI